MKKLIILFILLLIPCFAFAEAVPKAPNTLDEAETMGKKYLEMLPKVIKEGSEAFMRQFINIWNSYVMPALKKIWSFLGGEVEKRRPDVEKEFKKEKEEIKQTIPKAGKSLWERLKDLISSDS